MLIYLLGRYIEGHRSKIDFSISVDARQHEEYTCNE